MSNCLNKLPLFLICLFEINAEIIFKTTYLNLFYFLKFKIVLKLNLSTLINTKSINLQIYFTAKDDLEYLHMMACK